MSERIYWNPSCLVIPLGNGRIRCFNPWSRRNIVAEMTIIRLIDRLMIGILPNDLEKHYRAAGSPACADVTEFSLWDNAFKNPDFCPEDIAVRLFDIEDYQEFFNIMTDAGMLLDTLEPEFIYDKRSMVDRFRGCFHEQISTEGLLCRTLPGEWWVNQKFNADRTSLRDTAYKYIEERFLAEYFKSFEGLSVLDIGSGTGYFTSQMAKSASLVVGVDYNQEYVEIARQLYPKAKHPNLDFITANIIDLSSERDDLSEMHFDRVIMIDMFLFFFNEHFQRSLWMNRMKIMENILHLLKQDGQLLIMDPHPMWLTPWSGCDTMPFAVLTEYRDRFFKVTPTLEEMTCFLSDIGLRIIRILEPRVGDDFRNVDERAYRFMNQFPQWWFFITEKK